jgi:hypothetical protein
LDFGGRGKTLPLFLGDKNMEEEKRKRKIKEEEPVISEEKSPVVSSKKETKKSYKVILVTPTKVVYSVGSDCASITKNIWGMQLKPGDEIYL